MTVIGPAGATVAIVVDTASVKESFRLSATRRGFGTTCVVPNSAGIFSRAPKVAGLPAQRLDDPDTIVSLPEALVSLPRASLILPGAFVILRGAFVILRGASLMLPETIVSLPEASLILLEPL